MSGPLGLSLAPYIRNSKSLYRITKPFADWYAGVAGYRKVGLKYDDLLVEEREDVQKALSRLTPREAYDRAFRLRQASQCSVLHRELPKEKWMKTEEDTRYLKPHVLDVVKENEERKTWDTMKVSQKH